MSTVLCSRCNRPLRLVTVVQGTLAIGPSCAKKEGITPPKQKTVKRVKTSRQTIKTSIQLELPK